MMNQGSGIDSNRDGRPAQAKEYLSFTLGSAEYGVDIQSVQELRGYELVTQLANAPAYLKGVINLRGIIVPILDLRIKLGNATPLYDQFTVVVILDLGNRTMGVVVDSVSDVIELQADQVKPPPALGEGIATYVLGLGSIGERMLILVDIENLLSANDAALLDTLAA